MAFFFAQLYVYPDRKEIRTKEKTNDEKSHYEKDRNHSSLVNEYFCLSLLFPHLKKLASCSTFILAPQ